MNINIPLAQFQRQYLYHVLYDDTVDTVVSCTARHTGKTMTNCLAAVIACLQYRNLHCLMLRRITKSAEQNLGQELKNVLELMGMPSQFWYQNAENQTIFANGSMIQIGYCRLANDWEIHKGSQWPLMIFEEGSQFKEVQYMGLRGSCRPSAGCTFRPKKVVSTNPDGAGIRWIKAMYINEETREPRTAYLNCDIRANPATLERDPAYVSREIRNLPEVKRRQWELGDPTAQEGSFWQITNDIKVRVSIPPFARFFGGVDPGWRDSFAYVLAACWTDDGRTRIHITGEVKRTKLGMAQQARAVLDLEKSIRGHKIAVNRFSDTQAWDTKQTPDGMSFTTASTWAQNGMTVQKTFSKDRVAGWKLVREMFMDGRLTIDPVLCPQLIIELEDAVFQDYGEDMEGNGEDHLQDSLRYLCVSVMNMYHPSALTEVRQSRAERVRQLQSQGKGKQVIVRTTPVGVRPVHLVE